MDNSADTPTPDLAFIADLARNIDYAEGSTVSKTVLKTEGVNVVLFSFDKGEELSEHTAAMPVIVQVLEGEIEISGAGKTVQLKPGGMVHFTTRLPHAVKALTRTKMMLYMLV